MAVNQNIGAQSYLKVVEIMRDELLTYDNVRTVTVGDITEVDLSKQTIFPLAHLMVGNASFGSGIITFDVSILVMDIVHKDTTTAEPFIYQNDNELYVLNTVLNTANRFVDKLFVGSLYDGNTYVDKESVTAEPFKDRFENLVAGWAINFSIVTRNNIDRCNS